ncbi:hypothetical protein DYB26_014959, partial [Aphanomyces astaci]
MEDPSSGNDRAMNVELPGSDHDEEREDRSRSDRSASPTAGSVFQGRFQDRGRPRGQETVGRCSDHPKDVNSRWHTAPTDVRAAEKEDVDMGQTDVYLHNAPALPKHPTFKGSTKEERRTFMVAYNLYISQTTALIVNGTKPFIMPVNACIDPVSKQRIAEWDMGKGPYEVTEADWVAWFRQGYDVDPRALDTLKKRIKAAVVFDMSVQDADSRIGKMLDGLAAAIRRDRQEWVIKEESPAIVKIITDAVKPVSLHRAVTEQMALTRNKPLKKDVYRFVRWLREYAIGHERFVGYEEDTKPAAKPDPPKTNQGGTHGRRTAPTQSTPLAPATTPQAPPGLTSAKGCLKCKSTSHRVRECLGITEEEAVKLVKAHGRALGRGQSDGDRGRRDGGRGNGHRMATMKTDPVHTERAILVATVEGVLTVNASLLDSGADLSVASGGLVSALLAAGAAPEITTMGPFSLRPYGADSRPVVVTKQVRFGRLEFKTGCGPLMLRGLRVWVDEAVAGVELTLGLPVMQKLGYSDKSLLENARRQQAEWDFADQSIATPGEAMHRTLRMEETLVDDIDDDEGMCCATPDWGTDLYPTDDGQVDDDPV